MAFFTRKYVVPVAFSCLALLMAAGPAFAKTAHHKKHHTVHHSRTKHVVAKGSEITRIAQRHLLNLGYYTGAVDGVMGKQTRAAIKAFQREHHLKADGVLNRKTQQALDVADVPVLGGRAVPTPVAGAIPEVHQDYIPTFNGDTKVVSSRFARVDVSESGTGAGKRYAVNLNGQSILVADGQPSVIGISTTYDLGTEDAVIFTTYSASNSGCMYRNHVLVMNNAGSKILDVANCTRDYQASVTNGSLYIKFGEPDDARVMPATWRVEGETVERL